MPHFHTRRQVATSLSLAAAASLIAIPPALAQDEPPETTTLRLGDYPGATCLAPTRIAEQLLRAEGFTEIRYVVPTPDAVGRGDIDFDIDSSVGVVARMSGGEQLTVLAGVHFGCYELFAHPPIRTIGELRHKRIGISDYGESEQLFIAVLLAYVGLDPNKDVEWVTSPTGSGKDPFLAGKVDAFIGFPPEPQELRARNIGRMILNLAEDAPWSRYFCCMPYGNRSFVRDHPVATKRYLRAILKAADYCAAEPKKAAERLVATGYTTDYDFAVQTLTDLDYEAWREHVDPADTLRFYALRLREVGMISADPNRLVAEGSDFRFLNELKLELKA